MVYAKVPYDSSGSSNLVEDTGEVFLLNFSFFGSHKIIPAAEPFIYVPIEHAKFEFTLYSNRTFDVLFPAR